jgi:beta-lactam-binding protein with PASTA domain
MSAPPGTPAGKYSFRLNVLSVQNPDDDFAEGPVVAFELAEAKPVPPPNGKKFPWFFVTLALILIGGGVAVAMLLGGKTSVPDLVNMPLANVTNALERAKLTLSTVSLTNAGTNLPGRVVTQFPEARTKVKKDSGVAVTVREQPAPPPEQVKVPSVVGRDSVSAVNALLAARLSVTNLLTVATTRSNDWNMVVDQAPKAGQLVPPGTPVTLSVGVKQAFKRPIAVKELMVDPAILKRLQPR